MPPSLPAGKAKSGSWDRTGRDGSSAGTGGITLLANEFNLTFGGNAILDGGDTIDIQALSGGSIGVTGILEAAGSGSIRIFKRPSHP